MTDWFDVNVKGEPVGFVTGPDPQGRYHGFLDNKGAGSKVVGTYGTKEAAKSAVIAAHLRS